MKLYIERSAIKLFLSGFVQQNLRYILELISSRTYSLQLERHSAQCYGSSTWRTEYPFWTRETISTLIRVSHGRSGTD